MAVRAVTTLRVVPAVFVYDRPPVAHQGVDQAALADVGAAGDDDLPGLDQVPAQRCAGHEGVDLLSGIGPLPLLDGRPDRLHGAAQGAMILVQEDRRGPRGAGLGQGKLRGGRQRIGLLCGDPLLPRQRPAAGLDEDLPDHGDRGVAAMAMQFDRLGRAAADDDFLTRFHAESPDGQSPVGLGLEPSSAAGVEVCGDRKQGPRPFDQQTCHRPAPGRRQ